MIPIDRQTLTLIAVVVCIVGLIVMFRELKTAKEDVEGLKGFSMNVMKHMQSPPPPPPPRVVQAAAVVNEGEVSEEKTEDNSRIANVQQ